MDQKKYNNNLYIINNYIYSYNTKVGYIYHDKKVIKKIGYKFKINNKIYTKSPTTSRHINLVTNDLKYKLI